MAGARGAAIAGMLSLAGVGSASTACSPAPPPAAAPIELGSTSSPTRAAPPPVAPDPSASAAAIVSAEPGAHRGTPYEALFEPGRSWTLAVKRRSSFWDEDQNDHVERESQGTGSCRVAEAGPRAAGFASRIECDGIEGNGVPDSISGWWLATSEGLFRVERDPTGSSAPPSPDAMLFARRPVASKKTTVDPKHPEHGSETVVDEQAGSWCHLHTSWGGDEGWQGICVERAHGLRSASWGWAGGSTHEVEVTAL